MKSVKICFFVLTLFAAAIPAAWADSVVLNTSEDALRAAMSTGGTVEIRVTSGQVTLTQPIVVQVNTTLMSTGIVTISGNNLTRLFVVNPNVNFTIRNLALFSGRHTATNLNDGGIADTAGGAIYNNGGNLTLLNSTISNHAVLGTPGANGTDGQTGTDAENGGGAAGGAIFNKLGTLTISNCTLSANSVVGGTGGKGGNGTRGVISNGGNGGKGGTAGGAGVYSQGGTLLIYNSTFTNNVANGGVAGVAGSGSGIGFNGQNGGSGAAVGGGVATDAAYFIASGNTFVTNVAAGAAGLVGNPGANSNPGDRGINGGEAFGGAIYNRGVLLMTNCTLVANSAVGGAAGNGGAGSTQGFGSRGGDGGDGGNATGGAIENTYRITLIHSTLAGNKVVGGAAGQGGASGGLPDPGNAGHAGMENGGAISNEGEDISVANTILTGSVGGNLRGLVTDLGGNISSDTTVLFTQSTSRGSTDPGLTSLANNGGPTWTMALLTNSPAVDAAVVLYSTATDQRGTNRLGAPDIGSFEFALTSTNLPGSTNTIPTNTVVSITKASTNTVQVRWQANTNLVLQGLSSLKTTNWLTLTNLTISTQRGTFTTTFSVSNGATRFFRTKSR
jgi:hypothetical protein